MFLKLIKKHLLKINSIKYVNYPAEESSLNDIIEFIVKFVEKNDNFNNSNINGSSY